MQEGPFSRRNLLAAGAAVAGGALLPGAATSQSRARRKRLLRIAHLTDTHVQPERGAGEGLAAALAHVAGHKDKVDLILTGGDLIMDAMGATREGTRAQWEVFQRSFQGNKIRIEHTIGNHDVFGWNNRDKFANDPDFGKKWACDELGIAKPYRSLDFRGWHIIVLDSTFPKPGSGYTARLDDEQFEWLKGDLEATSPSTPILVISHIPIICACAMFDGDNENSGNWQIPGAWMHIDARRIKDLFRKHPNVKTCLSGHIHLIDEVLYNGVKYVCNGAVSAGWWGGDYQECTYGYGLLDLFDDGTVENQYVLYPWKTR